MHPENCMKKLSGASQVQPGGSPRFTVPANEQFESAGVWGQLMGTLPLPVSVAQEMIDSGQAIGAEAQVQGWSLACGIGQLIIHPQETTDTSFAVDLRLDGLHAFLVAHGHTSQTLARLVNAYVRRNTQVPDGVELTDGRLATAHLGFQAPDRLSGEMLRWVIEDVIRDLFLNPVAQGSLLQRIQAPSTVK